MAQQLQSSRRDPCTLRPCPTDHLAHHKLAAGVEGSGYNDWCLFPQKNITGAYQLKKPSKSVVKVIRISAPAKDAVYNYSIQTLNSTELAKKELYREMAKVSARPREGGRQSVLIPQTEQ